MDYCLLEDVFPDWKKQLDGSTEANISVGCTDLKSAAKARKEQKKKAKRCKDPSLRYLESDYPVEMPDPDRPAFRRQQDTLPMNKETGTIEARPFGNDTKEEFQLPKVPGASEQYSAKRPKYFGASEDDTVEDFAPFTNIIGDDPAYRLDTSSHENGGAGAGAGADVQEITDYLTKFQGGSPTLPSPSLEDAWKPITPPGAPTAFFQYLATPRALGSNESILQKRSASPALGSDLSKKLDEIFSRLDQLEQVRRQSSQTEVLLFVGSGLLLLGSLELISRNR
jgi:hypothetical protein